jgi:ADP-glucose pyrophosphorylase
MKGQKRVESTHLSKEKKIYSSEEKRQIMQRLDEERRRNQRGKEAIRRYLSDKKIYTYKGSEYYKVSDYKQSFYVEASVMKLLDSTVMEIELERSGYTANRNQKGFIKWDPVRETILISLSKVRVYYKPFKIEEL